MAKRKKSSGGQSITGKEHSDKNTKDIKDMNSMIRSLKSKGVSIMSSISRNSVKSGLSPVNNLFRY